MPVVIDWPFGHSQVDRLVLDEKREKRATYLEYLEQTQTNKQKNLQDKIEQTMKMLMNLFMLGKVFQFFTFILNQTNKKSGPLCKHTWWNWTEQFGF